MRRIRDAVALRALGTLAGTIICRVMEAGGAPVAGAQVVLNGTCLSAQPETRHYGMETGLNQEYPDTVFLGGGLRWHPRRMKP